MNAPNEGYFHWLVSQTEMSGSQDPHRTFWSMLHQLHTKPFRWFIHNDDNRWENGRELRDEYADRYHVGDEDIWGMDDASVLEFLVALTRHLEFESEARAAKWFWKLIENLGLQHYNDAQYSHHAELEIDSALDNLIKRRYGLDGQGGLFPLRDPQTDQTRVEIWYQMQAYLLEGEYVANGP